MKISDMMDHIQDDSVPIRINEITSAERIKEITMAKLHNADTKPYKRSLKTFRVLLIAAVVVMTLSVSAIASLTGQFSLRDMQGKNPKLVSMYGITGMAEYEAGLEWEDYLQRMRKKGENLIYPDSEWDNYAKYGAFSQDAKDELDALLVKYGLRMHESSTSFRSIEGLYDAAGVDGFMPTVGDSGEYPINGEYYDDGTFTFSCAALLPDGTNILYNFHCQTKGTFTRLGYLLNDFEDEWSYTTEDGTEVLLAIGNNKSIMAADLGNCFVIIDIRSGTVNNRGDGSLGAQTVDRSSLEDFAECFDFTKIKGLSA